MTKLFNSTIIYIPILIILLIQTFILSVLKCALYKVRKYTREMHTGAAKFNHNGLIITAIYP